MTSAGAFGNFVLSTVISVVITYSVNKLLNRKKEWFAVRADLFARHNQMLNRVIELAKEPSCVNHLFFIYEFDFQSQYLEHVNNTLRTNKKKIKALRAFLNQAKNEFLLNFHNEEILNLHGSGSKNYGDFLKEINALFIGANQCLL